jgi:hypothetical protein
MQSKKWSLIETVVNVLSGFGIAQLLILYLLPLWGFQTDLHDSITISAMFTSISMLRGYICRRIFNYYNSPTQVTRRYIRRHYKNVNKSKKS